MELAAPGKDADPTALLRLNYELAWELELIDANNKKMWNFVPADSLSSRYNRLNAEAALLRARGRPPKPGGPPAPDLLQDDLLESFPRAKAAFAVARADGKEVDALRVEVAREGYQATSQDFMWGMATQDRTLLWSLRVLEAERAISDRKEDQAAAFERHWSQLRAIEAFTARKMAEGKIGISDFMTVRCERLQAEAWWLEGRSK